MAEHKEDRIGPREERIILFFRTYIFLPTIWLFYFMYDGVASSQGLAIAVLVAAFLATLFELYAAAYRTVLPTLIMFIISIVSYFLNMEWVTHGALFFTIYGSCWRVWHTRGYWPRS